MADIRIQDLPTNTINIDTDLFPFEASAGGGNYTTSKNTIGTVLTKYESVYSTVNTASASFSKFNSVYTQVNTLSSAWPYRTGDTIVEIIPISVFSASGTQSSTSTSLAGSERASFLLDLGNTAKWKKSGCANSGNPIITWYVVGRSATGGVTAEWDLYDRTSLATIAGSNITTASNATWNVNSIVIPQANFPSTMTPLAIRSRVQTAGTVDTYSSIIQLTWTIL